VRDNKGMIISSPYLIILSAEEHAELTVRATGARAAHRDVVQPTSSWPPLTAGRMPPSPHTCGCTLTPCASGGDGSISNGWPDSPIGLGPDGHAGSAPCRSLR
jgi:hypothetical protein